MPQGFEVDEAHRGIRSEVWRRDDAVYEGLLDAGFPNGGHEAKEVVGVSGVELEWKITDCCQVER